MLTHEQVKQFAITYVNRSTIPWKYEFKLCYLKNGSLWQLVIIDTKTDWQKFIDFINSQEDLLPDMLLSREEAVSGKYPVGSKILSKNDMIYKIDTERDMLRIKLGLLEAIENFVISDAP